MDAAASEAASIHHTIQVHTTIRASYESEKCIWQASTTGCTTAATGRGSQQAESRTSRTGCAGTSRRCRRKSVRICYANESVPATGVLSTTASIWQHAWCSATRSASAIPCVKLHTNRYGQSTSTNGGQLWRTAKPVRAGYTASRPTTSCDHGSIAGCYPGCNSESGESSGSEPAYPTSAESGILSSSHGCLYGLADIKSSTKQQKPAEQRLYPHARRWSDAAVALTIAYNVTRSRDTQILRLFPRDVTNLARY